jgi:hypothetical protein
VADNGSHLLICYLAFSYAIVCWAPAWKFVRVLKCERICYSAIILTSYRIT